MIFKNLKDIIAKNATDLEKDLSPQITRPIRINKTHACLDSVMKCRVLKIINKPKSFQKKKINSTQIYIFFKLL